MVICPKARDIKKQAMTIKNDFTVALVKADACLAPRRLNIVFPDEARSAKRAKPIYPILYL